jgi:hypothetical protein
MSDLAAAAGTSDDAGHEWDSVPADRVRAQRRADGPRVVNDLLGRGDTA